MRLNFKRVAGVLFLAVLILFLLVVYVFGAVTLSSPANYTFTNFSNNTYQFIFSHQGMNDSAGNYNATCNLTLDGVVVAINTSVLNGTDTVMFSNTSFTLGRHFWNVTCRNQSTDGATVVVNRSLTRDFIFDNTAPVVTLHGPANLSNVTYSNVSVSFNMTDTGIGGPYNCSLFVNSVYNNSLMLNNNTVTNISAYFSNGTFTWNVSCLDNASNRGTSAVRQFTVDTVPPSAFINYSVGTNLTYFFSTQTPSLSFQINDSLDPVIAFTFYVDGLINTTGFVVNSSWENTVSLSSLPEGNHTIIVQGRDDVGNLANSTLVNITVDATSPSITLLGPGNLTNTSDSRVNMTFNVTDNLGGPYNCSFYVNSAYNVSFFASNNTVSNFTTYFGNGTFTWNVSCFDNASNRNTSAVRQFTVDTVPPAAFVNFSTAGNLTSFFSTQNPSLSFQINDSFDPTIAFTFYVDGLINTTGFTVNSSWNNTFSLTAVPEGNHTIIVQGVDDVGNAANSTLVNITVDVTAPTVTLQGPANLTNTTNPNVNMTVNVTDNLGGPYNCSLYVNSVFNTTAMVANNTSFNFSVGPSGFANGTFTWNVSCLDNASNRGTGVVRQFTVDNTAPNVTLVSPANGAAVQNPTVPLVWNATDFLGSSATMNCNLTFAGSVVSSNVLSLNNSLTSFTQGVVDGTSYTWNVSCTDGIGNVGRSNSFTFSVSIPSGGGSSGGGGGGGGGGAGPVTVSFGDVAETASSESTLGRNDKVSVKKGFETHTIQVVSISSNSANLKIDSLSQFVTVVLGETLLVDLDRDAVNDVSILLSNVVNGKGTFVIKSLLVSQPVGMVSAPAPAAKKVVQPEMVSKEGVVPVQEVVPVAPSVSEVQPPVVSERELPVVEGEGVQKSKVSWVVGAVFAVLVILGGLAYYFTRRKP